MLKDFEMQVSEWTLIPGDGGRFEVEVNGKLLYSKLQTGRHPDVGEIRKLLRQALDSR
jgi:selenoprotein W-related protein